MLRRSGPGFTLPEIMLALVVTLMVMGSIYKLLLTTQRAARAQAERVVLQSSVRAGSLIVTNELGELGTVPGGTPEQNDILAMGAAAVTYRAMRGTGFICQAPEGSVVRLAQATFSGHRNPQAARDEAYVFAPGDPATGKKDTWLPLKILSVATTLACPAGQGSGITLTLSGNPPAELLAPGTPVRFAEIMELRLYRADDNSWLGIRSVATGEAIQPLVGPLAAAEGFALEYLDAFGAPTLDRTAISTILVRLRGMLQGAEQSAGIGEELITRVALRNSPPS
jgi:hypothetical protein